LTPLEFGVPDGQYRLVPSPPVRGLVRDAPARRLPYVLPTPGRRFADGPLSRPLPVSAARTSPRPPASPRPD
jgi:hypothetical protein